MSKVEKFIPFLFLISSILTAIWFSKGTILAAGEEGSSIFNSISLLRQISFWQEVGTGYPLPVYATRLFPILFVKFFGLFRLPLFLSQAVMFWILISAGTLGTFYLAKLFFKNKNSNKIAVVSGLFYLLNLYSQSQVFGRFLYSGMFLWAYLPIFILVWLRWLKEKNPFWLVSIGLSSILFSLVYLQVANVFSLYAPVLIWILIEIMKNRNNRKKVLWTIEAFVGGVFVWTIFNVWWVYPFVRLAGLSFSEVSNWKANFDSLRGVSQYFSSKEIFLLRQSFLFGPESIYYTFYSQIWVKILGYLALFIAVVGWIKMRKEKYWVFLTVTSLAGWFISKGSNPPFGYEFFKFLFSTFPFTAALRNPYEKFGLVWLLPYSIFFGMGVYWLSGKFKGTIKNLLSFTAIVAACGILVLPMWTGDVFPSYTKVEVPDYYLEANRFLDSVKTDGRILMFPITPGDSVKYTWGYRGVEPSEFLFNKSSISKILRAKYFDDKYWELERTFVGRQNYNPLLDEINVSYLILHNDLVSEASGAISSAETKRILAKNPKIHFLKNFGELGIYEYTGGKNSDLFITESEKRLVLGYKKLNAMHYVVNVKGAKEPFRFIFKETYNDLWEARIEGKNLNKHFLVYNYANGWEIDKTGDYNIEIVFKIWPWE